MAPNTLPRARAYRPGWVRPAWYTGPFAAAVCYADGGDAPTSDGDDAPRAGDAPEPAADDWAPPTREEWETAQHKLRTASAEAANRRKWLKAAGYDPKTGQKIQLDEPDEPEPTPADGQPQQGMSPSEVKKEVERAVAEARIEGMRGAKKLVAGFNAALAEAGWNGQRLELIMPLVDFEEIDLDDPEDLRERIENVKKIFPEGFKRTRMPAATANGAGGPGQNGSAGAKVDAADKRPPAPEPKGWAERLAGRALRGEG